MKYREFWISDRTFNVSEGLPSWRDGEQNIHTIDYAAYTDALKMLDEMAVAIELADGVAMTNSLIKYRAWLEGMK